MEYHEHNLSNHKETFMNIYSLEEDDFANKI